MKIPRDIDGKIRIGVKPSSPSDKERLEIAHRVIMGGAYGGLKKSVEDREVKDDK